MKNKDVFNEKDYARIASLLAGEMDEDQARRYREQLQQNPDKARALEQTEIQWKTMNKHIPGRDDIDTDAAWQKLSMRIELDAEPALQPTATAMIPLWVKWAASWLIIITLGTFAWLLTQRKDAEAPLFTLNTYDENLTYVHTLADGSIIYLGNHSEFSFPEMFATGERKVKLQGEAFFDITSLPDQPFLIETPHTLIEVLGTSFNVKTLDNKTMELFVESGRVKVSALNKSGQILVAERGELLVFSDGQLTKSFVNDAYNTAWRRNHMHFKDESLQNIIKVLNQNHPVQFSIEDSSLNQRRLTVTFFNNSASTIAELISLSLGIAWEQESDSTIILKPGV